jgi:hypothetical protein
MATAFAGAGQIDTFSRTFTAGAALKQFDLVKLNGTTEGSVVPTAFAADIAVGVAGRACASGDEVPILLRTKMGTLPMRAEATATAIVHGDVLEASEVEAGAVTVFGTSILANPKKLGIALKTPQTTATIGEAFEVLLKRLA